MRTKTFALALWIAGPATAWAQSDVARVYTHIDDVRSGRTGLCRTIENIDEGQIVTERCPRGPAGWSVTLSSMDARNFVVFGRLAPDGPTIYDTLGGVFTDPHSVIEWRLIAGRPFATIQRYFFDKRQALIVHRLQPDGTSCVAAVVAVRRGHNENEEAADIADAIGPTFRCGRDKPATIGKV
jgi:hypothetical protein